MPKVRPPAVAGSFYPRDAKVLRAEVDRLLEDARRTRTPATARTFIVPHAGYIYSGPIAATAYARIRELAPQLRRVVLLGPSHYVRVNGLAVPSHDAFETPLGEIPLDRRALDDLLEHHGQVVEDDAPHGREHSLEVQLPFLQRALEGQPFTLVPFAVGHARPVDVAQVLEALDREDTLILISSDLSHYLSWDEAKEKDGETAQHVLALEPLSYGDACGAAPVNGLLTFARARGLSVQQLDLRNSGDTAGDKDRVVGYGAFAFASPGARA